MFKNVGDIKVKKRFIWLGPLLVAIGITFYQIFGNSQSKKEVVNNTMESQHIRKSVVAGSWYPGEQNELRNMIKKFFDNSKKANISGEIIALISPHAGYIYSGFTAANSYKQIIGADYDAVIVIAPSHHEAFSGVSVYSDGGYETPLGIVPIEKSLAKAIVGQDESIRFSMDGHRDEHSLEIQLPFLQMAISDFKLVPISFMDYSLETCKKLADAITKAVTGKKVLLVASSDLYHGYSYEDCIKTDNRTIDKMLALQPEEFCKGLQQNRFQACGGGPIVVAEMVALNLGANKATLLYRTNSGDVTGQKDRYVVGYSAIAIYKENKNREKNEDKNVGVRLGLNEQDKQTLLKIARQSIEYGVRNEEPPPIEVTSPILKERRGAFVTLTKEGMLRGCIGYIFPIKPLATAVQEMATAAAFRDPRFMPVKENEVSELEIEISVLTPLKEIKNVNEIEIGKHGIIIEKGMRSGLLLPQVATEYGWDRTTFLEHTCRKAGLPDDAWKDPEAIIKIFSAEIFHEEK